MAKNNRIWRVALLLCLSLCLCLSLVACDGGENTTDSAPETTVGNSDYTIRVSTTSGIKLTGISAYVYADATMDELETMKMLDENGSATFTATTAKYVVVLMGVPEGYQVEPYYTFDSKCEANIVLTSSVITGTEKPANKVYGLGDIMYDFTITASDGVVYTLSELLQEKDAVVLNFWYLNCPPCKMEFPYMQMAYAEYKDRIELLAINCEDGNDAEVNAFKAENEYTFPMAIGDKDYWYPCAYSACPTTIVVDRYGVIVYMHTGYFDEVAPFNALFRTVTGDDYTQTLISDLESLITEDDYRPDGSQERPYELGGTIEFDVKVPANGKVYYNLYRLDNVTMRIENPDAYVIIDGVTYYPVDGVIEMKVSCPDTFTPLNIAFGNTSGSKNTVHVRFVFAPGNVNNPIELVLGENNVTVNNVNGLGTYYTYTATGDGKLQITILDCNELANADIHLYNNNTYESVYLSSHGVIDPETGLRSITITVNAGDVIQIIFGAAIKDPETILHSVTIKALASFMEGEGGGVINDGRTGYSVTVLDQAGNPVPGVKIHLSAGTQSAILTTDENGTIGIRLKADAYLLELTAPSGYVADTTSFLWSPAKTHLEIRLVSTGAFRVHLQKKDGTPISGVPVRVYSDAALEKLQYVISSDANGALTFVGRADTQYYLVLTGVDSGLLVEDYYSTTGEETVIILSEAEQEGVYGLSDPMPAFTVTDIDGKLHSLNWLLQDNDVVVLVFWKNTSVQSVITMTALQKAYETYGDRVAVLGLNPVDKLEIELSLFRNTYGLTFPLAMCDKSLADSLQITDYPTVVVVDREGKISLIQGGVVSEQAFRMVFDFYLAEDYVHTPFESVDALLEAGKKKDENEG